MGRGWREDDRPAGAEVLPDRAFDALADPVRREILAVLAERDECNAGELSQHIQRVGRTAVSTHLRVLRTAGLINERRDGRYRYYSVEPTGPAQDVIRLLQDLFQRSLDDAKVAAEAQPGRTRREATGRRVG